MTSTCDPTVAPDTDRSTYFNNNDNITCSLTHHPVFSNGAIISTSNLYVVTVAFWLLVSVSYGISIHDSYVGRIHFLQSSAADLGAERESLVFAIGAFARLKRNGDGKQCLHCVPLGARVVSGG